MDSFIPNLTPEEHKADYFASQLAGDARLLEDAISMGTHAELSELLNSIKRNYGIDSPLKNPYAAAMEILDPLKKEASRQLQASVQRSENAKDRNLRVASGILKANKDTMSPEEYKLRSEYIQAMGTRNALSREKRFYISEGDYTTADDVKKDIDAITKTISKLRSDLKQYKSKSEKKYVPISKKEEQFVDEPSEAKKPIKTAEIIKQQRAASNATKAPSAAKMQIPKMQK